MTLTKQITAWSRSISGRLFISHILVGGLTPLVMALLIAVFTLSLAFTFRPQDYRTFAEDAAILWLLPESESAVTIRNSERTSFLPPGYALVVDRAEQVRFVRGQTSCTVGENLQGCAPHFANLAVGESAVDIGGETWIDIHLPLSNDDRVLARYASPTSANIGAWVLVSLPEILASIVQLGLLLAIIAIPISIVLVAVFVRPFLRRIDHVAEASQRFADGDLAARVQDVHHDEISTLARQFDTMADVLQQNIFTLRDLLKSNAALTEQAEQAGIQGERLRLARDLHDELAQQLFSLSASSAAVPGLIGQDAAAAGAQARKVAELAEETLISLRSLLVDLRPGGLLEMGLARGLKTLCIEWEREQQIAVELSIIISREHFSAPLQTAVFQIVRESLTNVAKHAEATQVTVTLVEGRQQLVVSISDNGRGLMPTDLNKNGHFGLVNMRERAEALGGRLYRESESGRGTTIRAVLPLVQFES